MPVKCYINDLPLVFGINSTSIKITYQILMLITNTIIADCRGAIYSFFFFCLIWISEVWQSSTNGSTPDWYQKCEKKKIF